METLAVLSPGVNSQEPRHAGLGIDNDCLEHDLQIPGFPMFGAPFSACSKWIGSARNSAAASFPQLLNPPAKTAAQPVGESDTRVIIIRSVFAVFSEAAGSERNRVIATPFLQTVMEVSVPGQIAFQADLGAPATATFDRLSDFREHADHSIRYFSGIATYSKEVQLPPKGGAARLWLDLGQVNDLADVWVNGKLVGTAWKPPYQIAIGNAVVAGKNRIEIRLVNLWVNRLIGDVQPGVTRKFTFT